MLGRQQPEKCFLFSRILPFHFISATAFVRNYDKKFFSSPKTLSIRFNRLNDFSISSEWCPVLLSLGTSTSGKKEKEISPSDVIIIIWSLRWWYSIQIEISSDTHNRGMVPRTSIARQIKPSSLSHSNVPLGVKTSMIDRWCLLSETKICTSLMRDNRFVDAHVIRNPMKTYFLINTSMSKLKAWTKLNTKSFRNGVKAMVNAEISEKVAKH